MSQITAEEQNRISPKLLLARSFVDLMHQQIQNLVMGGLTEEQSVEAEQENTEDIVVRGIGSNPIQEMRIDKGIPPTYPLQWFESNNWGKPPITLPGTRDGARISDYFHVLAGSYRRESVSVHAALIFLNLLCQQTKGILRFDWVSLGVLIGCEGRTVIPLSMFNLKITKINTKIGTSQAVVSEDSLYDLALLILGGFRIHLATNQAYIDRLQTALKSQLITPDFVDGVEVAVTNFAQLYVDPEFIKLVCGIDMFFAVFPHHARAKCGAQSKDVPIFS